MFTGVLPHRHGYHSEYLQFEDFERGDTFLSAVDFNYSFGITNHGLISSKKGFSGIFDEYIEPGDIVTPYQAVMHKPSPKKELAFLRKIITGGYFLRCVDNAVWRGFGDQLRRIPLPKLTDDMASTHIKTALRRSQEVETPYFLFMNFMDAHRPYQNNTVYDQSMVSAPNTWTDKSRPVWEINAESPASEEYTRYYREIYAAAIDYLDRKVSDMVEKLLKRDGEKTTIIVTSDHGQNLGSEADEYYFNHNSSMSEGTLHVPFDIINPPDCFPETESRLFSHLELGEVIKHIVAEEPLPDSMFERPVVAEIIGRPSGSADRDNYPGDDDGWEYYNRAIRCGYLNGEKYQWDSQGNHVRIELNPERPNWQRVVEENVDIPEALADRFDVPIDEYKQSVQEREIDAGTSERLKSLGYL
jgi:hypothetical protein